MLSRELQHSLSKAGHTAARQHHEYVTLEHILHALLDDPTSRDVIHNCGGDVVQLKAALESFMAEHLESLPAGVEAAPQPTAAFERVLQRALLQAQGSGQPAIDGGNVLAAMFQETRSHAVYLLAKQGISKLDVLNYISHGISKRDAEEDDEAAEAAVPGENAGADRTARDPLAAFTVDLIELAAKNGIDPLIGREAEIRRTIQVLCRRRQEQPGLRRRARRRQDRCRRGSGPQDSARRGPGSAPQHRGLRPGYGCPDRRRPVPRPIRAAPQGRAQNAARQTGGHPVHRRNPHHCAAPAPLKAA